MTSVDALELVSQENVLIKSTPAEETLIRLAKIDAVRAINNTRVITLAYIVEYLIGRHHLLNKQIMDLSSEYLSRMPEIIFSDRRRRALLFGWIPIFGWIFAFDYIRFKTRVKFLRAINRWGSFDKESVEQAMGYLGNYRLSHWKEE